jgi:hypothetical protein
MDDLKKLAKQFAAAAQIAGPTSYIPEVTGYSQAGSIEGAVKQGLSSGGALASKRASEADAADEAARQAAARKISNKLDPSKYQKVRKSDGGFDFLDPDGNKISIEKYTQITGERRVDALKDSENPIDQEYVNDWSNMNDLAQAMYNGDSQTVEAYIQQNPLLKGRKPEELMIELMRKYPHLYGKGTYQDTLSQRGASAFSNNPNALVAPSVGGAATSSGWSPS